MRHSVDDEGPPPSSCQGSRENATPYCRVSCSLGDQLGVAADLLWFIYVILLTLLSVFFFGLSSFFRLLSFAPFFILSSPITLLFSSFPSPLLPSLPYFHSSSPLISVVIDFL